MASHAARVFALGALVSAGCAGPKPPPAAPVAKPLSTDASDESENYKGEEGFAVSGVLGTVDAGDVQAAFATRKGEVDVCYAGQASDKAWLGGPLELKVRIGRSGAVSSAIVTQPLGNAAVEHCVLDVTRGITFPKPKGGPEAEVTYGLTFRGRMSLAAWTNAEVGEVFEQNRAALDACGRAPKGLKVAFFVTPGGRSPSVGLGADEAIEPAYATCVAGELGRWRFADPRGRVARAVYTF